MKPNQSPEPSGKIPTIQGTLFLVIILLPFCILWSWGSNLIQVIAAPWTLLLRLYFLGTEDGGVFLHVLDMSILTVVLPFAAFRLVTVLQVGRLYHNQTTKLRTIGVAVLTEMMFPLFYGLVSLPALYVPGFPSVLVVFGIPLPFLLLTLLFLMRKYPLPDRNRIWAEQREETPLPS